MFGHKSTKFIFPKNLPNLSFLGGMKHVGREASGRSGISSPRDLATLDHRMAPRLEILLDMPAVSREVQLKHAWNQDDRLV